MVSLLSMKFSLARDFEAALTLVNATGQSMP